MGRCTETISRTRRTVLLIGLESCAGTSRSDINALEQFPIYEEFNPLQAEFNVISLNRAKNLIGPDGISAGMGRFMMRGSVYVVGSGVANVPPVWTKLLRICGFAEFRYCLAANTTTVTGTSAANTGADGAQAAGEYYYKVSKITTSGGATYETVPTALSTPNVTVAAGERVDITFSSTNFPAGTKARIYRTLVGAGGAATHYFVGEFTTSQGDYVFSDKLNDDELVDREPIVRNVIDDGTSAGAAGSGGALSAGTYTYKVTVVRTDSASGHKYEDSPGTITVAGVTATQKVTLTLQDDGTPATGVVALTAGDTIRVYRSTAGSTSDFYFLTEETFADGMTIVDDTYSDTTILLRRKMNPDRFVEWVPVPENHDSATILNYLDSRKYPATGVRGNCAFAADAGNLLEGSFDLMGVYNDSTQTENPEITPNPGIPPRACGISLTIVPQLLGTNSSSITPVVKSVGINLGANPSERLDMNQAGCLKEIGLFGQFEPHWTMQVEVDASVDWLNYFDDNYQFRLDMTVGPATSGKRFRFVSEGNGVTFGTMLSTAPAFDDNNNIRCFNLDFILVDVDVTGVEESNFLRIIHY